MISAMPVSLKYRHSRQHLCCHLKIKESNLIAFFNNRDGTENGKSSTVPESEVYMSEVICHPSHRIEVKALYTSTEKNAFWT